MVSIVIVTRNTKALTLDCLNSIAENTPRGTYEVIVVDNASSDGTGDALRIQFPNVKLVESNANLGFGKANNIGAGRADGEYLLFLNSDTLVLPKAIEGLAGAMDRDPEVVAAAPRLIWRDGREQRTAHHVPTLPSEITCLLSGRARKAVARAIAAHEPLEGLAYLSGSALMVRRSTFDLIGGWDEAFFLYYEDLDLCMRLVEHGKMKLVSESDIVHFRASSTRPICAGASIEGHRSRCLYMAKHHGVPAAIVVGLAQFVNAFFRAIQNGIPACLTLGRRNGAVTRAVSSACVCLWYVCGMPARESKIYRRLFCDWQA